MLLFHGREWNCNDHTFLGWQVQVFSYLRFCMSQRDLSKNLAEQMSVVNDHMAP